MLNFCKFFFLNLLRSATIGSKDALRTRKEALMLFIMLLSCLAPGIRDSDSSVKMLTGCKSNHNFFAGSGILLPIKFLDS